MKLSIAILLFALPLLFLPSVFNPYEFPKFIFFVSAAQVLALIYFLPLLKSAHAPLFKMDWLTVFIVGFGSVVFILNLLGLDPKTSLLGSMYRHQGFLILLAGILIYLVVRSLTKDMKTGNGWGKVFTGSALSLSLIALSAAVAFYVFNNVYVPTYQGRIIGTMGNPNFLGGYLAMLLPFIFLDVSGISKKWQFLTAVLTFLTIVLTQSRSAIFAALLVFFIILLKKRLRWKHVRASALVFCLMLFAALIWQLRVVSSYDIGKTKLSLDTQARYCLYLLPEGESRKFFFSLLERTQTLLPRASFCEGRLAMWTAAIEAVWKRPLLGIGQENFELIFPSDYGIKVDNAHNIFLEVAVSSGLIGLAFFLAILFLAIKKASFPIKLSLLAFLIVAQFNPLSIAQFALFWILIGIQSSKRSLT